MALVDEREATWSLIVQKDGHQVGPHQTEQLLAGLESPFQEALRRPTLLIATVNSERDDTGIPPSIEQLGVQALSVAPLRTLCRHLALVFVGREGLETFSREEELILSTLAEQSAIET